MNWKDFSETMAEHTGKRKARDMNGSVGSDDHYEPEIKARRTNDNRRRSSFVRGIHKLY